MRSGLIVVRRKSPAHRSPPAEFWGKKGALVTGDESCRVSGALWTALFTLIPRLSSREASLSNPAPLYSRRAAHPKAGLDTQLATVTAPSVMPEAPESKPTSRLSASSVTYKVKKDATKVWVRAAKQLLFSILRCDVTLIHLLHRVTLVTEMHL